MTNLDQTGTPKKGSRRTPTVARVIAQVADQFGIPRAVALAIAFHESGLKQTAVGDNNTSFGVYQLHQGGELGSHDPQWAYNVRNNATQALSVVASVKAQHPDWDWGMIAAAAQRPADPTGYAQTVNSLLSGWSTSGQRPVAYFTSQAPAGAAAITNTGNTPFDKYLSSNPQVSADYGYLSAYLDDPVIGPILAKAAQQGWSENKLQSALENTSWWKTHSQTARQMQALQQTDPASYKESYGQVLAQVSSLATSMGLNIPQDRLAGLATTALWSNWSSLQIQNAIGREFHFDPNAKYAGTAGSDIQKYRALAAEYLVPMSNQTLDQWTRRALSGKLNPTDVTGYLAQQAKTLYPWMSKAIDQGTTPATYLDPYVQQAANTLELSPGNINLMDPKFRSMFETVDPKTGQRTERGLANALTLIRTDPRYGYDFTQGARDESAALAANIAQAFGYSGSGSVMSGISQP